MIQPLKIILAVGLVPLVAIGISRSPVTRYFKATAIDLAPIANTPPIADTPMMRLIGKGQLPPTGPELVNVDIDGAGYRITHLTPGRHFVAGFLIDKGRIPNGYSLDDIHSYVYDSAKKNWAELRRDSLDGQRGIAYTTVNHGGDFINGVIKVPESPETQGYAPTTMSDIKAADPSSMVTTIDPPAPNSKGSAVLSTKIMVPMGRNGLHPDLELTYNSDGGNGWMGQGWNLGVSSISIDTRWGTPAFRTDIETETYLADGKMLAMLEVEGVPTQSHRTLDVARVAERQFYHRREGGFNKIIRHGDNPNTYTWEITGRDGSVSYYGTKPTSRLAAPVTGNIVEWKLDSVRDVFGNYMALHYEKVQKTIGGARSQIAYNVYLRNIEYTRHTDIAQNFYVVEFHRQANCTRKDIALSGRYGFLTCTSELLDSVSLYLKKLHQPTAPDSTVSIRGYSFRYLSDPVFAKSLLQRITQFGARGSVLSHHDFDYYNDIGNPGAIKPYNEMVGWPIGDDNISAGDGLAPGVNHGSTAIGGSRTSSNGGSLYIGVGPDDFNFASKSNTAGIQFSASSTSGSGMNVLIDIDGDNMPDKVFISNGAMFYRANLSKDPVHPAFDLPMPIPGINSFSQETGNSFGFGIQENFGGFGGVEFSSARSVSKTYFADVNGDGLIDIVSNGTVYFNHLEMRGTRLRPIFEPGSDKTPVKILASGAVDGTAQEYSAADREQMIKSNPLEDVVRSWEAPFAGTISVTGSVALRVPNYDASNPIDVDNFANRDGVRVAIQQNGQEKASLDIGPNDFGDRDFGAGGLVVSKGDHIYFRVQSGKVREANGAFDRVKWDMHIAYSDFNPADTTHQDVFGSDRTFYRPANDFLVSNPSGILVPGDGKINIEGSFSKKATMDSVKVSVILVSPDSSITRIFSQTLAPKEKTVKPLAIPPGIVVGQNDRLFFKVEAPENINMEAIRWVPVVYYPDTPQRKYYPVPEYSLWTQPLFGGAYRHIDNDDSYAITPLVEFLTPPDGKMVFTLRTQDTVVFNNVLQYQAGALVNPDGGVTLQLQKGRNLFASFENPDSAIRVNLKGVYYIFHETAVTNAAVFLNNVQTAGGASLIVHESHPYVLEPKLGFQSPVTGTAIFTVLKNAAAPIVVSRQNLNIVDGVITPQPWDTVLLNAGDNLTATFVFTSQPVVAKISTAGFTASPKLLADAWTYRKNQTFGTVFRGWGGFVYDAMENRSAAPIDESKLTPPSFDQNSADALHTQIHDQIKPGGQPGAPADFSLSNSVFRSMETYSDGNSIYLRGGEPALIIDTTDISSSRYGLPNVILASPFSGRATGLGAVGVDKVTTSNTLSGSGGAFNLGGALSTGSTTLLSDFRDMNGDGFPDILSQGAIQFTTPLGGLTGAKAPLNNVSGLHSSSFNSQGLSYGGQFPSGGNTVTAFPEGSLPEAQSGGDLAAAQSSSGTAKGSVGFSLGVSRGHSDEQTSVTYLDINGDGLPDRLNGDGTVQLNLGKSFTDPIDWNIVDINKAHTDNKPAPSFGFDYDNGSITGGLGISSSATTNSISYQDVNGDGLVDKLTMQDNNLTVSFNTSAGFMPEIPWTAVASTEISNASGESANGAFSIGIPLPPILPVVKLVINPGFFTSNGISRTSFELADVDGDSHPDLVSSGKDGELLVSLSTIGRTNMLRTVRRPLGGSFIIDYKHSEPNPGHPGGKWVLASVEKNDGVPDDGVNPLTTYDYSGGHFDRYEREFFGFAEVRAVDIDRNNNNTAYRQKISRYDIDNYYSAGNLLEERIEDNAGKVFTKIVNDYYRFSLSPTGANYGNLQPVNDFGDKGKGIGFCPLKSKQEGTFEGSNSFGILNEETYGYDSYGNITVYAYSDKGKLLSDGKVDFQANISYLNEATADYYIIGLPTSEIVNGSDGQLLKQMNASYHPWGNLQRRLQEIDVSTGSGQVASSNFYYHPTLGMLTKKQLPGNQQAARLTYNYEYDDVVNTYIDVVRDSYGLESFTRWDYRFGLPLQTKDYNDNQIAYRLDQFGRVDTIAGPNEFNENDRRAYTLAFDYHPDAPTPYAVTSHFDKKFPAGIRTINFIDGFRRSVQVKKTGKIAQTDLPNGKLTGEQEAWLVSGRNYYDAMGRVAQVYYPTVDPDPAGTSLITVHDAVPPTVYQWDVLDRETGVTLPDGSKTSQVWSLAKDWIGRDVQRRARTDANKTLSESLINGSGLKVMDIMHPSPRWSTITKYIYDPIFRLTGVTDSAGNTVSYTYDLAGRRTRISMPDGGETSYTYDPAGNLTEKETPAKQKIRYKYDFNRLTDIYYPRHPENNVHCIYGSTNRSKAVNGKGRLLFQQDASGSQQYEYGLMGEVKKNVRSVLAPFNTVYTYETSFSYDSWNRIQTITYPDHETVSYAYNSAGLLESVTGKNAGSTAQFDYVKKLAYDKFEQRIYIQYGNGSETYYGYETTRRRLHEVENINGPAAARQHFMDLIYVYDPASNIIGTQDIPDAASFAGQPGGINKVQFAYDGLYRLTHSTGQWGGANQEKAAYAFDIAYNGLYNVTSSRLSLKSGTSADTLNTIQSTLTTGYVYTEKPHQASSVNHQLVRNYNGVAPKIVVTRNYTDKNSYDANGNEYYVNSSNDITKQDQSGERRMLWDEENRLRAVSMNGFVSSYIYDASGERVVKLSTKSEGAYIHSQLMGDQRVPLTFSVYVNPYFSSRNGNGAFTKHVYINGQRICSQVTVEQNLDGADVPRNKLRASCTLDDACAALDTGYDQKLGRLSGILSSYYDSFQLPRPAMDPAAFLKSPSSLAFPVVADPAGPGKIGNVNDATTGPGETLRYFYHPNHLGSTNYVTDMTGKVVQYLQYLPYGQLFMEKRDNYSAQFAFSAKEQDQETGMYYFGARYFDPEAIQWLGIDPQAEKFPAVSPYCFSLNSPISLTDPDGRSTLVADIGNHKYMVVGGDQKDGSMDINLVNIKGEKTGVLGQSATMNSFFSDKGQPVYGAVIDPMNTEGISFVRDEVMGTGNSLIDFANYFWSARNGERNDFKDRGVDDIRKFPAMVDLYHYRGGYFGSRGDVPVFASARDIGNIGAGFKAGAIGLPWIVTRFGFDIYQNRRNLTRLDPEGAPTQAAERLGFDLGQSGKWDINWNYNLKTNLK